MITVRAGTEDDLDELASLGAALAQLHHGYDPARFSSAATGDVEDGYRFWFGQEMNKKGACFRVVDVDAGGDRLIAGYVYGRKEGRDWNRLLDPHAELIDLYVRPEQRRKGIAAALVESFIAWAEKKKAGPVVLSTAAKNPEAQALFARLGFRPTMIEMTRT